MTFEDVWQETVEREFPFLGERGFRRMGADSSFWETSGTWGNGSVGIKVARSTEFQRVDVNLIRLVDGDVPPYPIWITSARIDWVLLDTVLTARSADHAHRIPPGGLSRNEIEIQLRFWADALATVAPEFLDGDASCIDEASSVLRAKVAAQPQTMTVSLPESASDDEVAEAVRQASQGLPSEVQVVVNRYRRPR